MIWQTPHPEYLGKRHGTVMSIEAETASLCVRWKSDDSHDNIKHIKPDNQKLIYTTKTCGGKTSKKIDNFIENFVDSEEKKEILQKKGKPSFHEGIT